MPTSNNDSSAHSGENIQANNSVKMHAKKIPWSSHQEVLNKIRKAVFVDEQHVSEEEEWDGLDPLPSTEHFAVFNNDDAVGTARIVMGGKIGRMCVLKSHRGNGAGACLLRQVLRHCLLQSHNNNLDQVTAGATLHLNAQQTATQFYAKFGFVEEGELFDDAGIPHRKMRFNGDDAGAYERIFGDEVIRLNTPSDFSHHIEQIARTGSSEIIIVTNSLSQDIYSASVCDAFSRFARRSARTTIRVLVQDTHHLGSINHPLVQLAQRLPSSIEIRKLKEAPQNKQQGYCIIDTKRMVFFNDEENYSGFVSYNSRAEAQHQLDEFLNLWRYSSEADPNLSRLSL